MRPCPAARTTCTSWPVITNRLNAISFMLLPPSLLLLLSSVQVEVGAGVGWTVYPPVSTQGTMGVACDVAIFSLHLSGVSSLAGSINFLHAHGAPKMRQASDPLLSRPVLICAGVILSVMGAAVFLNVLGAPNPWPWPC